MKSVFMALAFAAGLAMACGNESDDSGGGAASVGSAGSIGGEPGVDGPSGLNFDAAARLVVTSQIALEVTDLRDAYRQMNQIASGLGGYLAEGRIFSEGEGDEGEAPSSAYARLRVPVEQHDALLQGLRDVSRNVRSEETKTREVTGEYTDFQSRLTNLRRSEVQYQDLLTRSSSIDDILDVTQRLDIVRGEIEGVQGRLNLLGDQSDFATVGVTMVVPAAAQGASESTGLASPVEVFSDAAEGSVTVAHALMNVAAVVLVAAIWLAPLAVAFAFLRRPVQRLFAASKSRLS